MKTKILPSLFVAGMLLGSAALAQQTASTQPGSSQASANRNSAPVKSTEAKGRGTNGAVLGTQRDKYSYALGLSIGQILERQGIDVDIDRVAQGIKDLLTGGSTLLTPTEAEAVLAEVQKANLQKQKEKAAADGAENRKTGEAFLVANKGKEGVVSLPSGLQYKILKQGEGPKPSPTDSVVCNYRGTLIDGTEFDSSYNRGKPATFPLGAVIKGWTEALQLMPVGSKWQLFVPPDLAYGDRTVSPQVGPGSTLIFEVELLSIDNKAQ